MASVISAGTTSGTSLNLSGDTSGVLQLASNGSTTAVTIDTNQRAAFVAGTAALPAITTTGDTDTGLYFSAANTLDFSTNGTRQASITSAGLLQFNSGYGSVATAYGCRAWVNFGGTGTVSIRASGNVSSITDNGVGEYTVNITTAMPDVNYCYQICGRDENNGMGVPTVQADPTRTVTTTALPMISNYPFNQAYFDMETLTVAIFR